jgi:uncharacterized protein DUF6265
MRVIVLLVFLILGPIHGAHAQAAGIERVRWLSGCWQMSAGDRTVEEHWMAPRGNTMLGMGRTVRGDSLVDHELVILRFESTRLAYEAHRPARVPRYFRPPSSRTERSSSRIPLTTFLSGLATRNGGPILW